MQEPNDQAPVDGEDNNPIDTTAAPDQGIKVSPEDEERAMLLASTDAVKGEQLKISLTGEVITEQELRDYAVGYVSDPENMYNMYYLGIDKLLKKYLPQHPRYQEDRERIREEKNTYLTRGHRMRPNGRRGADGRMGYPTDAETVLNLVIHWAATSRNMAELYAQLLDLNVKSGYGMPAA
ncbi:MAG: hypothetical protein M3Y12_13370 [Bacteroidota bacterium]|nr:hypothetical protein [Bacteroidota bacterium]